MRTIGIRELTEHINEILRMVKEKGEPIEVVDQGEVLVRLVPADQPVQAAMVEQDNRTIRNLQQLAEEIGKYWKDDVSAVDAIRDVRREL